MAVLMHGPAFTEEGEIVERQVPESDVPAYEKDGYVKGPKPEKAQAKPRAASSFGAEEPAEEEDAKKKKGK